jgi:hypothetical protein
MRPNSRKGRTPVPEKIRFLIRLNKEDGPAHPIHGKCWVLNSVIGGPGGTSKGRSSRMAYRVQIGPIPDGLQVLHKCDNPECVRVDHLFLGTISDNIKDAIKKGRWVTFPGNQHAAGHVQSEEACQTKSRKSAAYWARRRAEGKDGFKLSVRQVSEIRSRYRRLSYLVSNSKQLAKEFGVSVTQINRIVSGSQRSDSGM